MRDAARQLWANVALPLTTVLLIVTVQACRAQSTCECPQDLAVIRLNRSIDSHRDEVSDRLSMSWNEAVTFIAGHPDPQFFPDTQFSIESYNAESRSKEEHMRHAYIFLQKYEYAMNQVQLDLALHPQNTQRLQKSISKIQKHLTDLMNHLRSVMRSCNVHPDNSNTSRLLETPHIDVGSNTNRASRHFLTLYEMLRGMDYLADMIRDCNESSN